MPSPKRSRTRKTPSAPTFPTVHARELSSFNMVARNEAKFSKVVDGGVVKQWVGIGWVSEGVAQSPRDDALPRVVRD